MFLKTLGNTMFRVWRELLNINLAGELQVYFVSVTILKLFNYVILTTSPTDATSVCTFETYSSNLYAINH
jgi:hypothetical protein